MFKSLNKSKTSDNIFSYLIQLIKILLNFQKTCDVEKLIYSLVVTFVYKKQILYTYYRHWKQ